jgi:hypothetical protein
MSSIQVSRFHFSRGPTSLRPHARWSTKTTWATSSRSASGSLLTVWSNAGPPCRTSSTGRSRILAPSGTRPCTSPLGVLARCCSSRIWHLRLVLLVDRRGLPVGYTLVPANEKEYEPVRALALADGSQILVCDKGLGGAHAVGGADDDPLLWGRQYAETLRLRSDGIPITACPTASATNSASLTFGGRPRRGTGSSEAK